MLKKRFSQNLIKDGNILRKMVALAGIVPGDTVVEIGAGRGDLTRAIASCAARVIAIELDRDMIPYLETVARASSNIEIVPGDILSVDIAQFAREHTVKVMGNIPYGITGPIVFKLIDERRSIESAFLTVQKEIGERITANPGTRAYGSLSVVLQLVAHVRVLMRLKPQVFIPPPKVESIYFAMRFRDDAGDVDDALIAFIRGAFSHKRKFMRHALLERCTGAEVEALYEKMTFPRSVRAETLEPGIFRRMFEVMKEVKGEE
ncbi:MAG: 16S rRNA (adenine(1518)-N(6)/adenine(1519)-N(6))-dimethyltransferase RsmA [Syntrophorhabdaceae bacterium]|nr:16S rRNA (adenine(1518)-N(6)/adenine(1519)-N(6))-dimethyltransferase RsmA [Syntrophorhabdaceae bacterium]